MEKEHKVTKTKADRARSPWFSLEFVALKSRGNQIGVITDLMSSCVASGRTDLLYELVGELQLEIDSLKHNTRADRKKLQAIREQVPPAPWLALKDAKAINEKELPSLARGSGHGSYRTALQHSSQTHRRIVGKAASDRAVPRPDHGQRCNQTKMFEETRLINTVYAAGHGMIQGKLSQEKKAHDQATETSWRKPCGQETGSVSPRKGGHSQKRKLVIAALKSKPGNNQLPCSRSSAVGAMARKGTGLAGARRFTRSFPEVKGMGSILFHAFPQELWTRSQPALTGFARKSRPPKKE